MLFTSSCSHFIDDALFLDIIKRASFAEKRTVQLLELRGAAQDHPVLLAMPETAYLKCAVLRVV
jgi:23S rRNA (cytosine1962-C5)-methyltransferase